ncbi:unnamed protein product [Schistosoma margrebowiei]|uniref:Uncharacterized protein n=1 Tax=Schistosoma margrebowiei TaxID=48269 RepID=A0A183MS61_9TREM|nr:unnamed protein product [Schistosoma margrebowiei]
MVFPKDSLISDEISCKSEENMLNEPSHDRKPDVVLIDAEFSDDSLLCNDILNKFEETISEESKLNGHTKYYLSSQCICFLWETCSVRHADYTIPGSSRVRVINVSHYKLLNEPTPLDPLANEAAPIDFPQDATPPRSKKSGWPSSRHINGGIRRT